MTGNTTQKFDIYLAYGCKALPRSIDLVNISPSLAMNEFREKLLSDSPEFLGVNLSLSSAKTLLGLLKSKEFKARGVIIPAKYRDNRPNIDLETAFQIADKYLEQVQLTEYPDLHFGKTTYTRGHDSFMYFTFGAVAHEWTEAGLHPDGIFASIDKLDGHVWSDEERDELSCP